MILMYIEPYDGSVFFLEKSDKLVEIKEVSYNLFGLGDCYYKKRLNRETYNQWLSKRHFVEINCENEHYYNVLFLIRTRSLTDLVIIKKKELENMEEVRYLRNIDSNLNKYIK